MVEQAQDRVICTLVLTDGSFFVEGRRSIDLCQVCLLLSSPWKTVYMGPLALSGNGSGLSHLLLKTRINYIPEVQPPFATGAG